MGNYTNNDPNIPDGEVLLPPRERYSEGDRIVAVVGAASRGKWSYYHATEYVAVARQSDGVVTWRPLDVITSDRATRNAAWRELRRHIEGGVISPVEVAPDGAVALGSRWRLP